MEPDSQSPSVYLPHAPCYRRFSNTYRSMGTVDSLLMLVKGALAGFVIAAPVGPVGVLCIQRTLQEGRLSGLTSGLGAAFADAFYGRSEEHTSELQSLMRISYAVFCLKTKNNKKRTTESNIRQEQHETKIH